MLYTYDTYGNLTGREDGYWGMTEDFGYDNLNRLVSTPAGDITYDGKGNITEHDAAGVFGYASSRPYALSQITLSASDFPMANQTVTFNSMNRPDTIGEGSTTAVLKYFEDGERSQMSVLKNSGCFIRNYFGNQFTTTDYTTQSYEGQKQVLFLGGDAYTAPAALVREKENGTNVWSQSLYYIVRDNLGSIVHIVDSTGVIAQELSYDAWGRLRDPNTQQIYAPGEQPELLLDRGYCGHEHLADFNLINMNARLYDPWTARFLSPDPYVQLPDFTQSLNRYSYCLNNPLAIIDLSGKDSWYTNDKSEIEDFLWAYRVGFFQNHAIEDWLNNRSGWEYEGEGLNRIDLDRMRLYTTRNQILGGYRVVNDNHITLSEIVLTTYVYNLTSINTYDFFAFASNNDFASRFGAVNSLVGYALANSKHTYRLTNSFGQFDPHYYTSGFKANQYVRTTPITKLAPFFQRLGTMSNIYSFYNSSYGFINATNDRERLENGLDMFMEVIGFIKHPATIGLSTFWSLGGKELFWLYNDNVISLQVELEIVGLPSTMPFK